MGIGKTLQGRSGKRARAAADIQDTSVGRADIVQQHAVSGMKEKSLQQVAIVAATPTIELLLGVGGEIGHARSPPCLPGSPCLPSSAIIGIPRQPHELLS